MEGGLGFNDDSGLGGFGFDDLGLDDGVGGGWFLDSCSGYGFGDECGGVLVGIE